MGITAHRIKVAAAAGTALAVASGLLGCGISDDATRSGGPPPPLVLTVGTDDPEGRPASTQIVEFARQVESLSSGALRIEPRYRAAGTDIDDWDQAVAQLVMAGDLDLGLIPARAWDTEGVNTLRALHAPLLVTTDPHMDAVAQDEELVEDLLSGLEEVGVTGLALLPEGIRHFLTLGGNRPVVDMLAKGGDVRAPWSETTWAFFEALGAEPNDAQPTGSSVAAESEIALHATLDTADSLIGNLPLFPKVNSLVVNTDTFDELTAEQQEWLREAADATRDWAVETRADDRALAEDFCADGGTIVHDPMADSKLVRDAAATVTEALRQDAETAATMDRIAALGPDSPPEALPECSPSDGAFADADVTPDGGDLPDGVYRVEFTDNYLRDQGLSPEMIAINHGVWTVTLQGGRFTVDQVGRDITDQFSGVYEVRGTDLYWQFYPDEPPLHVRWRVTEDGSLEFPAILAGPPDAAFHWGRPWRRVGDPSATPEVTADTIRPEGGDLPDGTYRFRLTDDYLADHGLPPENIAFNHGVWTTTLDDGHWTVDQAAPDVSDHFEGVYEVRGRELWWRFHDVPEVIHLIWSVTDEGDLVFEEVPEPAVPDFQFDLTWQRIE